MVNNVGLSQAQPLEEISLQDLSNVLDLNLRPAVQITQALLPAMKQSGWGRRREHFQFQHDSNG